MLPMNDRIHKGVIDNYIITALLGWTDVKEDVKLALTSNKAKRSDPADDLYEPCWLRATGLDFMDTLYDGFKVGVLTSRSSSYCI